MSDQLTMPNDLQHLHSGFLHHNKIRNRL